MIRLEYDLTFITYLCLGLSMTWLWSYLWLGLSMTDWKLLGRPPPSSRVNKYFNIILHFVTTSLSARTSPLPLPLWTIHFLTSTCQPPPPPSWEICDIYMDLYSSIRKVGIYINISGISVIIELLNGYSNRQSLLDRYILHTFLHTLIYGIRVHTLYPEL